MVKDWKTTVSGILAIVVIAANVVDSLIKGLPVDWATVVPGIIAALGLIFAKDSTKTV